MTNSLDGALGSQTPRLFHVPESVSRADADDCVYVASQYGLVPDPWQALVLDGWLGVDGDGRYSSPRCGLSVPRQCGKTALLEARILYGMVAVNERVLFTAHEMRSAQRAFRRLLHYFDNPRRFPKLHAMTAQVRRGNGQEAVYLTSGGSFELVARSRGSGRGFSADLLVLDEAQELADEQLAALLPTISAADNGQVIYCGTPVSESGVGEVFARLRASGIAGDDDRLCWHEWSCEPGVDLDDPASWAQANPALGVRLDPATVADERAVMDDATFARERLGIWESATVHRVISQTAWQACSDPGIVLDEQQPIALALDVSPDRTHTSIAVAGWTLDGNPFVDVIDSRGGEPEWSIARLVDLNTRHDPRAIVVDAVSAASSLIDALRQAGLTITVTSARDMAAACGQFFDAVVSGQLRQLEQPALNSALALARRRRIGDGGWAWSRKDSDVDITPLTTATLALFGLTSSEVAERPRKRSGRATFC